MKFHWNPPDQFMMYGIRMFGSNQEALRLAKLVPENGTEPSGLMLNSECRRPLAQLKHRTRVPGRRLNGGRREILFEVLIQPLVIKSCVIMPNEERNTRLGLICQATPTRGWKLFRSLEASGPLGCVMAPRRGR